MRTPFKKSLSNIPIEGAHDGSGSRQFILSKDDDVSGHFQAMTKGYLEPGSVFDWHDHENIDEFFIVLKGSGEISYKDGKGKVTSHLYKPGDLFYVTSGVQHKIESKGAETSEYFFVRLDA